MQGDLARLRLGYHLLVGQILRKLRQDSKKTQTAMASCMGVTQSTLSRIERGISAPTPFHVRVAAQSCGTEPAELILEIERALHMLQVLSAKLMQLLGASQVSAPSVPAIRALAIAVAQEMAVKRKGP